MAENDWSTLQFSENESEESEPDFEIKPKTKYKQSFCDSWLQDKQFSGWLEKVLNQPYKAKCNVCDKFINAKLYNLKKHKDTKEHKIKELEIIAFPTNNKVFYHKWLEQDQFKGWLQMCDKFNARCKFCCRLIKPKRHNLISHSNSETHKNNVLIHTEETLDQENLEEMESEMDTEYLDEYQDQSSKSSSEPVKSSKSSYPQYFRNEWLVYPKYKDWLQEDKNDPKRCICKICNKTIGAKKSNLESHFLSKYHQQSLTKKAMVQPEGQPSGKKYIQSFRDEWLQLKQFKNWLQRIDNDPTAALCSVCNIRLRAKKFNLDDHCRRAHHKRMIENSNLEILPSYSKSDTISKYVFNEDWLKDENFSFWLKYDENEPGMVICMICKKQLAAKKSNLESHSKSRTHIWRAEKESNLKGFSSNFTDS